MSFSLRSVKSSDFPSILKLIQELADFEKESDAVEVTVSELQSDFENNCFSCIVAEQEKEIVGMALYYPRYSTWKGKTIHLEDLIVTQKARGLGIGKALLQELIQIAKETGVRRMEWCVLDWNTNAIALYEKMGGDVLKDWYLVQMDKKSINKTNR